MSQVFQFPGRDSANRAASGKIHGRIQIDATPEGDMVTVTGAFADRLQHGVYSLTKTLQMFVDAIAETGEIGYTSGPEIRKSLPTPPMLPPGLTDSNFGELHG